ncbi:Region found in RelA / SpoT proteins [uncultured archaeon]|nr:Region found in RelA / SpoT proteins [uncultured archaeon]
MAWETPQYTKSDINNAGKVLINQHSSATEIESALKVLDNWRASHSYPLHIFQMTLLNKTKRVEKKSTPIVAQRLKRAPAILYKLSRHYYGRAPSMKLYQMQDIGGCRSVLPTISQARKLYEEHYLKGDLKHIRRGEKDYVKIPKEDGYRSFHLIYEYKSKNKAKMVYNGLLIEIQIRSKLQHVWATAIETVDFFTRQALKTNEGEKEWFDFFRLVSSAFAMMERCPIVPGTIADEKKLYSEIKRKAASLNVIKKMKSWKEAMKFFDRDVKKSFTNDTQFFLLELDILGEKLNITGFKKDKEQTAIEEYARLEKRHSGKKDFDVVLVGFNSFKDLKKAYPNYFLDSDEFVEHLTQIISKY